MRYLNHQITFQEIPDEISLSFLIVGCPLKCKGCHSVESWNPQAGQLLKINILQNLIQKYRNIITCVLFLGGEWNETELIRTLQYCKAQNLKTALYSGLDDVSHEIKQNLTYLKTGSWKAHLGGLTSDNTNQKLIEIETGHIIKFTAQGGQYGEIDSATS